MAAAKLDITAIVQAAVEQALKEAGIVSEELADPTGLSKPKAKRKPRKVKVKDVPGNKHECWKLIGGDAKYAPSCEGQTGIPATNPMLARCSRDIIEAGNWDELVKLYKKSK